MSLDKTTKKGLIALTLTGALGLASSNAMAVVFNDFTVDEGSVPGASANTFTADKITGNYVEVITFGAAGTFDVSLQWSAGQYVANDGTTSLTTQLGSFGSNGYAVYALYQGSGTYTQSGGVTTFTTTAGTGSLDVYIDASQNTPLPD